MAAQRQRAAGAAGTQAPTLISVQGAVTVRRPAVADRAAVRTTTLGSGDTLVTGPTGQATLLFPDGSQVKLNRNSTLRIPDAAPAGDLPPRLDLLAGELFARISPGRRLSIETPAAVAGVRGTELNLTLTPEGTATLTVGEGEVSFANPQGSVSVREGQQSVARPGQAPTSPVTVNVPFIIEWTNDLQPVALLLEQTFVSQDPARLAAARREAESLPPGPERSRRLGDVLHDQNRLQEALVSYQEAQTVLEPAAASEQAALEARVGQTLLELGKLPEAEAALRRSLELDPGETVARAGLVLALLSRRANEAALSEAREGVERQERAPAAHTALALAHIRRGEREAARRSLEQAVERDPAYAPAHAWQAFLLRSEARPEEARQAAQRAVTLAPFSSLARQALADARFALGDVREARQEAERAVALNPLSPGAHVSRGRALLQQGEIDAALREANQAVALDPELERARFFRGVVLAQQQRLDRAAAELQRAVALDPGYLEARSFLARVYLAQGRRSEALELVREAVARDPQFAPARAALGQIYWEAGRLKEAVPEYRAALQQAPGALQYHLELARVYLEQNDLPDALAHGLTAVSAAPGSSEAHALLGLIYDRRDNPEQALREYREALSLSPDNALARLGLGTSRPASGERVAEVRRIISAGVPASRRRVLQLIAGDVDPVDGLREVAQALLRDPSVISRIFKPGVTTEIAASGGRHDTRRPTGAEDHPDQYGLGLTHRDQFFRGTLHDLSFGQQQESENYRDGRTENRTLAWLNLAGSPSYQTQVLGQYTYSGRENPLPGSVVFPQPGARSSFWDNGLDLSSRFRLDSATAAWLHLGHRVSHLRDTNPQASADADPTAFGRSRFSQLGLEGRLDRAWGNGHVTTYTLFAGREQVESQDSSFDFTTREFMETAFTGRGRLVSHTLQNDYQSGSRLSLITGLTAERFSERSRTGPPGGQRRTGVDAATTSWLPFGQATYLLTRRDLVRSIVHKRAQHLLSPLLQPSEAFLVAETPSLAVGGQTTTVELDYEHRFSPRSFAKLFLFRSDVDDYFVTPAVRQTASLLGFGVPEVRSEGVGARYEHLFGRYLSGYLHYTYRDVIDQTSLSTRGRQLPMHPRSRAVLGVNYIDRAGTKLFLEADWRGAMFVDPIWSDNDFFDPQEPRRDFPSKLVVNLRLAKERTVRREWVLQMNNLFNAGILYWPDFPAPGRTFELQYRVRF